MKEKEATLLKRLHSHPRMEKDCNIPSGHVIIDRDVFFELMNTLALYKRTRVPSSEAEYKGILKDYRDLKQSLKPTEG